MMIEDYELRSLYQVSGKERLQKLEAGLLYLEKHPDDEVTLTELLREVHGLKGDSRSLGVEPVELLSHQFEEILRNIQRHKAGLTVEVSNSLYQGLVAIEQLVQEAVTGEPSGVKIEQVLNSMISITQSTAAHSTPAASRNDRLQPTIEDEELQIIYRTTSSERLQKLRAGLLHLQNHINDEASLTELLREIHSLKGDSRSAEVEVVAIFAAQVEDILKHIKRREIALTPQVSDRLLQGLTTVEQLVQEAVTGESSGVDVEQSLYALMAIASDALLVQKTPLIATPVAEESLLEDSISETSAPETSAPETSIPGNNIPEDSLAAVETTELQEIYQTTTAERLQKLETGLLQLEKHPDDEAVLLELLRETHSLKGDSRSVEMDAVETLSHQIEAILAGVQRREISLTSQVSDCLYQGLDAIAQLIRPATMASPQINTAQVLDQLISVVSESASETTSDKDSPIDALSEIVTQDFPSLKVDDPYRIDTIRVHTRDLDALMTQTEELTVTRIQLTQAATEIEQLATLWEDWKASKNKNQALSSASDTSLYEEKLESIINILRTSAQEGSAKLNLISRELGEKVRTLRLLPLSTVFQPFSRMVRDLAKQQSKAVELMIEGGETTVDKRILEEIKDALLHLIRNAVDHGIETPAEREALGKPPIATIWLRGYRTTTNVVIEVADDGRGLDIEKIKQTAIKRGLCHPEELESMSIHQLHALVLASGFSTRTFITEISGRGVGLDVVRTNVERLKGNIQIESTPGQGCTFRIRLSTSLATINVILVEVHGIVHALPLEFVQTSLLVSPNQLTRVDQRDSLIWGDLAIPVADLANLLELSNAAAPVTAAESSQALSRSCVVLKVGDEQVGFFVDRILNTQEIVLKPLNPLLQQARYVTGATILGTGAVCMILDPAELQRSLQAPTPAVPSLKPKDTFRRKPIVLLVEDSPLVRIQERRLFESAGYEVVIAVDGLDGYEKLRTRYFDAVVSDVEMPRLDGLSLTAKIRQHREYSNLPIILVTTLSSDADRQRGAIAGADAYITKGKFNQDFLLETLAKLI
jgi:two-component system, chemotaxis family, sensor kinase CheA